MRIPAMVKIYFHAAKSLYKLGLGQEKVWKKPGNFIAGNTVENKHMGVNVKGVRHISDTLR